jgi:hypothetical protein
VNKFCANDKCGSHIDVEDEVGAISFKANGKDETLKRVKVQHPKQPDLTLCEVCANVLDTVKL